MSLVYSHTSLLKAFPSELNSPPAGSLYYINLGFPFSDSFRSKVYNVLSPISVLAPYKYAGYPQLLRTARLEVEAEQLFAARDAPALLPAACELAHATVQCSALNAEELRREGGLEVLHAALSRCVGVLSRATRAGDVCAAVCAHVARCFAVACAFPQCRSVAADLPALSADIVPLLKNQVLVRTPSVPVVPLHEIPNLCTNLQTHPQPVAISLTALVTYKSCPKK